VVNDGDADSAIAVSTIHVLAVNQAPVVDLNGEDSGIDFTATFTEDGGGVAIADTLATVTDIDDDQLVSATVTLTNRPDNLDEGLTYGSECRGPALRPSYDEDTGVLSVSGTAGLARYQRCLHSVEYSNSSQNPDTDTREIWVVVNDGDADSAIAVSFIHVLAVNDQPRMANADPTFTSIVSGTVNSSGDMVDSIIGNTVTDVDGPELQAIAVTQVIAGDSPGGTWQYSLNGGDTWTDIGDPSRSSSLLLGPTDVIRFVPNPGFSGGSAYISFRAWDQSDGSAPGSVADTTDRDDTSPFSDHVNDATITVSSD
jgi:hypothetical protein